MVVRLRGWSTDAGLLIMRVGIGFMFIVFGWGKLAGGVERWRQLGGAMQVYGIGFVPAFWGFMAMFAELAGGLMLGLGLFVRPFAALMCFTMLTAAAMLIRNGAGLNHFAHAVNLAFVFAGLVLIGGGRFVLGNKFSGLRGKWYC